MGTSTAVAREFPEVHLISGSGDLFCGGMELAFTHAAKLNHDLFLLLYAASPDALVGSPRFRGMNPTLLGHLMMPPAGTTAKPWQRSCPRS